MPRLGGIETRKRLRAQDNTRTLPVILLTRQPHDRETLEKGDVHAHGYVIKPLEIGDFLTFASALGLFWLSMRDQR